jgi:hypothetical protein
MAQSREVQSRYVAAPVTITGIFAEERSRGQQLDTKTASLAAFSGTILALDTTLGQLLLRRDLGDVGSALLPGFLLAAIALLVSAGVAAIGVPRAQITFDALDRETGEVAHGRIRATPEAVPSGWKVHG